MHGLTSPDFPGVIAPARDDPVRISLQAFRMQKFALAEALRREAADANEPYRARGEGQ